MSSLVMCPLGTVLCANFAPCLLTQTIKHCDSQSDDEDSASMDRQDLTWDDHLDFDTELTKMKVDLTKPVEITTEMETVT